MQRNVFEMALKRKVSQITFSGHRVNDDYTINKRKAIMAAVLSAFDEAAQIGFEVMEALQESEGGLTQTVELR